jgi:hypothetical protein
MQNILHAGIGFLVGLQSDLLEQLQQPGLAASRAAPLRGMSNYLRWVWSQSMQSPRQLPAHMPGATRPSQTCCCAVLLLPQQALPVYLVLPWAAAAAPCDLGQQQCRPAGGCGCCTRCPYAPGILLACASIVIVSAAQPLCSTSQLAVNTHPQCVMCSWSSCCLPCNGRCHMRNTLVYARVVAGRSQSHKLQLHK